MLKAYFEKKAKNNLRSSHYGRMKLAELMLLKIPELKKSATLNKFALIIAYLDFPWVRKVANTKHSLKKTKKT